MKRSSNPFFVLRLPCSAGRKDIVAAAEERSFLSDPEACADAQNELLHLSKRLCAEIGWFPDLDQDAVLFLQEKMEAGEELPTDRLPPLAKLNASLYNFAISAEEDPYEIGYALLELDEQYAALDLEEITTVINQARAIAKVALAQESEVAEAITKKRDEIRQIITERLASLDEDAYIELVTLLAEKCVAAEDYEDGVVLEDIVDQYEVRMQAQLEEKAEDITAQIAHIQQLSQEKAINDDIAALIQQVQAWDNLAQPLQLKSQASGMPHEISERLGWAIRKLALSLHNEKGCTEAALKLVDAMRDVFAELYDLADLFDSDADTLNALLQEEAEAKVVLDEMDELKKQGDALGAQPVLSMHEINAFLARLKKLNQNLKTMALDTKAQKIVRQNLYYIGRSVVVYLHNGRKETWLALVVAEALQEEFRDMPELCAKARDDVRVLNRQQEREQQAMMQEIQANRNTTAKLLKENRGCLTGVIVAAISAIVFIAWLLDYFIGH